MDNTREIRHFHLFCGLGGGAKGFNRAQARAGGLQARGRCVGGIDVDPAIVRDFQRLAGVPGTVLDLFDRSQYTAWHGHEPPRDWREATPDDIRRAAGGERPHIVFTSPPCKGFSGLLNETRSRTDKYQALNRLTLRGIWLTLEAWKDDPPEFFLLENVPRIATRGRHLLDQIVSLLTSYGYAVAETTHDCGELGGLAQSRKRFLLVARHQAKVPPFLYEPPRRPLQAVGTVLGRMPLPGDPAGGPMHRIPALQWKTWVRLAFVEAGADWRSLQRLAVADGVLRDFAIVPDQEFHNGVLGVHAWADPAGTIAGRSFPYNGAFSIADPRIDGHPRAVHHGVREWERPAPVVTGKMFVGGGPNSVADPRIDGVRHNHAYRIVRADGAAGAVTGGKGALGGCVADPRCSTAREGAGKYRVTQLDQPAGTVIAGSTTGQGAFAVADPRPNMARGRGDHYLTGGHYGVVPYSAPAYAVTGSARHDNGFNSVADPRLPAGNEQLVAVIRALDDTWHRPFTTLELAALQSLVDVEETLELDGLSDSAWRERVGNAVPSDAAEAIGGVMFTTLLLAWSGETFAISAAPVWVRPVAVALALPGRALP
jgi:site-specific DNA-cytosine methylase